MSCLFQAKQLHEQGMNNTQIAKQLNVARMTVIRWLGV
ncbi:MULTISPECIES: helix-turn-helix domain-containing protein [unclassified Acinetobacter]|nr:MULTISPECIES: helix-turn-helix domain-containing protein [unclassified Acinetobacter]